MTESSGMNDPGSYDVATYAAAMDRIIKTGYQVGFLNELSVYQNTPTAMNVLVATGGSWVKGIWHLNPAIKTCTIEAAHGTLDRIDLIVVRRTGTTSTTIEVLKGTDMTAGTATAPTLTKNIATTYEITLAQIAVAHGTTAITTAMITDKRLSTDCGPVVSEMGFIETDTSGNITLNGKTLNTEGGTITTGGAQIIMGTARITGVGDPTDDQDVDTKAARNAAIAAIALPSPTGEAGKEVIVNSGGTGFEVSPRHIWVKASASDTLRASSDAEEYITGTSINSPQYIKTIKLPGNFVVGSVVRIHAELKGSTTSAFYLYVAVGGGGTGAYGVLGLGAVKVGALVASTTYEDRTVDFTCDAASHLFFYLSAANSQNVYVKNLRVYCDETLSVPSWT
jgi:hypothetical protein